MTISVTAGGALVRQDDNHGFRRAAFGRHSRRPARRDRAGISGVDGKFREFIDAIYPTNHTWGSNAVTINLVSWNKLSETDQAAIEKVAVDLEPQFWEVFRQGDVDSIETMTENDMKLIPLSDELKPRSLNVQCRFRRRSSNVFHKLFP